MGIIGNHVIATKHQLIAIMMGLVRLVQTTAIVFSHTGYPTLSAITAVTMAKNRFSIVPNYIVHFSCKLHILTYMYIGNGYHV